MADGRTHDYGSQYVSVGVPILVGVFYLWASDSRFIWMAVLSFLGCQIQRIASPDMDCNNGWYGIFLVRYYFGSILAFIWRCVLWPYSKLVPHRHWLSHGFFIGSLVRFFYLYFVYWIVTLFMPVYFIPISQTNLEYFLVIFLGYFMCDCLHLLFDIKSLL